MAIWFHDGTPVDGGVVCAQVRWRKMQPLFADADAGPEPPHISPEVFAACDVLVARPRDIATFGRVLRNIARKAQKPPDHSGQSSFVDSSFAWGKRTQYTARSLRARKFRTLRRSTIVLVADRAERDTYGIAFIYHRAPVAPRAMRSLCEYVFTPTRARQPTAAGETRVMNRGAAAAKNRAKHNFDWMMMQGAMHMFGAWSAWGSARQGLGSGSVEVRAYNPQGPRNGELNAHVRAHAAEIAQYERELAPAAARARELIATRADPHRDFRIVEGCDAFAFGISENYVVMPHSDSGDSRTLEFVQFATPRAPVKTPEPWLFAVAGCLCALPRAPGETVAIGFCAEGMHHGTLPLVDGSGRGVAHGRWGSALVTKHNVVRTLDRLNAFAGGGSRVRAPHANRSATVFAP